MLSFKDLDAADIICITPEKFDALTRKHKDNGGMRFFGEVGALTSTPISPSFWHYMLYTRRYTTKTCRPWAAALSEL